MGNANCCTSTCIIQHHMISGPCRGAPPFDPDDARPHSGVSCMSMIASSFFDTSLASFNVFRNASFRISLRPRRAIHRRVRPRRAIRRRVPTRRSAVMAADVGMGTIFDARTRDAHFRFEAHARENRASDDASSTQHRMSPSSASRAYRPSFHS